MSTDHLGIDVSTPVGANGLPGLDPYFTLVSGGECYGQALLRRLVTPRGSLVDDDQYGYDVRSWLGETLRPGDLQRLEREVVRECLADERTDTADATATQAADGSITLVVTAWAVDDQVTVRLTLAISDVTVDVLAVEEL